MACTGNKLQVAIQFDYIVYLRPDVKYINKFDTRYFNITTPKHVCIPNFHLFPKLNDRLCILKSCNLEDKSLNIYELIPIT